MCELWAWPEAGQVSIEIWSLAAEHITAQKRFSHSCLLQQCLRLVPMQCRMHAIECSSQLEERKGCPPVAARRVDADAAIAGALGVKQRRVG